MLLSGWRPLQLGSQTCLRRCKPEPQRRIFPSPLVTVSPLTITANISSLRSPFSLPPMSDLNAAVDLVASSSHTKDAMMEEQQTPFKLCTRIRLWEFPDLYMMEATDAATDSYLMISRKDGSLKSVVDLAQSSPGTIPKIQTVFGLIGMLKLVVGTYVLVIKDRECVGSYFGSPIFKISSIQILPCNQALNSSTEEQKKLENEFKSLLSAVERMPGLYFSYDKDLTLSLQRSHSLKESQNLPLWRQADQRFLWNNYMLEVLIENKLDPYVLPVIQGSYQNFRGIIGKENVDLTLIARRCTRRTGTRMWRRGADAEGYTANFVETEQIVRCNGYTASFVQVRGSIPFLWKQVVDLTYKPTFEVISPEDAPKVVERHFLDLRRTYGSILAVDLVNKHGGEGRLSQVFANAMQKIASDENRYVHFDFHRICGHVHFERLSHLYDQIIDFINSSSLRISRYFISDNKGEKLTEQQGVVRTNCIDCLDRTNVTQSMIGRKLLESQLKRIGILGEGDAIHNHASFDDSFKILWANHGDDISIQYSGTPALKGDFVRYGKRTMKGVVNDGYNALSRYYLNNFYDGIKQDSIDLLHGHYIVAVNQGLSSPFKAEGMEAFASFRLAFGLALAAVMLSIMSLRQVQHDVHHLLHSAIWAGLALGIVAFMRAKGRMFCNRPCLRKP